MTFRFRPLDVPGDFPRLCELVNAVDPEPATPAQMEEWEEGYPKDDHLYRIVSVDDAGYVTGYAEAVHFKWHKPGKFYLWAVVDQRCRSQGLGSALVSEIERYAVANGATLLEGGCRDNAAEARAFAERRGYQLERHTFESTLHLETFDDARFAGTVETVQASGIRFVTLDELPGEEYERKLHAMIFRNARDIPGWDNVADVPYEIWRKWALESSDARRDLIIIALDGDRFAGATLMQPVRETGALYTHHTSVSREYRGRKVALALKLLAVQAARRYNAPYMRTNNDSKNAPILAVNVKMGYVSSPGVFRMQRAVEG